jgi:hypothetical protein
MSGGFNEWRDITDEPRTQMLMREASVPAEKVYMNGLFVVQVYPHHCAWGDVKRVMIRWADARPEHDWALFQRIKNELFGPDRVALEVFPSEQHKQDVANVYWMFVMPEGFECPIEVKR